MQAACHLTRLSIDDRYADRLIRRLADEVEIDRADLPRELPRTTDDVVSTPQAMATAELQAIFRPPTPAELQQAIAAHERFPAAQTVGEALRLADARPTNELHEQHYG